MLEFSHTFSFLVSVGWLFCCFSRRRDGLNHHSCYFWSNHEFLKVLGRDELVRDPLPFSLFVCLIDFFCIAVAVELNGMGDITLFLSIQSNGTRDRQRRQRESYT